MLAFIENFLKSLSSSTITEYFFWILLGIAVLGLLTFLISRKHYHSQFTKFAEYTPVLLTSVGILGTFTGIVAGLLNFDIHQIDNSISSLLEGMKTAFFTSVIGVALSILLKIIYTLVGKVKNEKKRDVDIEEIAAAICRQAEENEKQSASLLLLTDWSKDQAITQNGALTALQSIARTLGSEAESSLLGQIKLLRADFNDAFKELKNQKIQAIGFLQKMTEQSEENQVQFTKFEEKLSQRLHDFAQILSKSATETVIEALRQVIVEFNQNLMEQFGENFKELNRAVKDLVQWQENYKTQLNEMIVLYHAGVQSLESTEKSVLSIEQKSQVIPQTMEKLGEVIEVNQHQIEHLNAHLSGFAELRDKAIDAIPQTQQQVKLMLNNVETANQSLTEALKKSATQMEADLTSTARTFANKSVELTENLANVIRDSANNFATQSLQGLQALNESSKELKETAHSIALHQKELNAEQQKTINQVIKFVENWQKTFEQQSQEIFQNFVRKVEDMSRQQVAENERLMRSLQEEGEKTVKGTAEYVNAQLKLIDDSMQREVERVMKEMGSALATISRQFTQDYTKLVEAMSNIVRSRI
ncbi:MotA/TolQ/ExbB proton channel family protein [Histophilus somni]|uniref:MotA/TolQ/ExbB proton channel domain-containing protein n=1 Tax=Histophilus somni (strain 129Pt) TaxID=205914 RepID=Q0I2A2_HISS1|nr:MotA/TolQ/ExbB proton channel family protein [Histophilus somni]